MRIIERASVRGVRVAAAALLASTGLIFSQAACAQASGTNEFSIVGGRGDSSINLAGAEVGHTFGTWNFASCQTFAEADVEEWWASNHGTAPGSLTTIGGVGGCRWWLNSRLGFDAVFGARLLSHVAVVEDKVYSTAFQFQEGVGMRLNLDDTGHYFFGARFRHVSNGSIKHPNAGLNAILLSVGMTF